METRYMSCCAIQELTQLGNFRSPKEALLAFCKNHNTVQNNLANIMSFYAFTAVVRESGKPDTAPEGFGFVKDTSYGPKFAEFLKKNKLGTLVETGARSNANYTKHAVKVWVWGPNRAGLNRWWKENQPPQKGFAGKAKAS